MLLLTTNLTDPEAEQLEEKEFVFFDETLSGYEPEAENSFKKIISNISSSGRFSFIGEQKPIKLEKGSNIVLDEIGSMEVIGLDAPELSSEPDIPRLK